MGRTGKGSITIKCERCGAEKVRWRSQVLEHHYCSRACWKRPPTERFWEKVDKSGGPDACWFWTAYKNEDGYGIFPMGKEEKAHRVAWILTNGPIPQGKSVLHKAEACNNRACCNPAHLYLGTQFENVRDMIRIGTKVQLKGEESPNALLTEQAVIEIRSQYTKVSTMALAEKFGVKICTIRDVAKRRSWRHVN